MANVHRSVILFFIPGNPGIASYYSAFFDRLKFNVPGLDIVTTNHIGFNATDGYFPRHAIDLNAQIAHKVQIIDSVVLGITDAERKRGLRVYIAGHSVGAYMAIKVMQARPEVVSRAYLLFPTISHIAQSPQGVIATLLLRVPGLIFAATALIGIIRTLIPLRALYAFVAWFTGFPRQAAEVTTDQVLTTKAVYTALTLARSEMAEIKDPDAAFWREHAVRCSAYWAVSDRWVSETHKAALLAVSQGMESYVCHEAPHAFCIRHGDLVADKVGQWMERDRRTGLDDVS